jgi:signal transduction histidine kinase
MKNKRSLLRAFYQPREQVYLALVFLLSWIAIMGSCCILYLSSAQHSILMTAIETKLSDDTQMMIESSLSTAIWVIAASLLFLALMLSVTLIALSYRVFGPSVQFKRFIQALRTGDYAHRGTLRKGDAFQDLMDEFNQLAAELEQRHKPT